MITTDLGNGAEVKYVKDFLTEQEAGDLISELQNRVPWTHGVYKMFGKPIKTPRLLYAMRDLDYDVDSSYSVTDSMVWTPLVEKLRDKVREYTGLNMMYAQLNYYRDGSDYIGYHADKEVAKGDIIVSISLGATRRFVLRRKDYKKSENRIKYEFNLEGGSLLIMNEGAAKTYWKHALPKMKGVGPRINITFRPK
jgi:alkylated DNA repair dioxygenase AlkB